MDDRQIEIGPLELQLCYELQLAQQAGSTEGKDFEDALHLHLTFSERLKTDALERFIDELDVRDYYDELERI